FGFDKNLIKETRMEYMNWKAKRPKDSSLNNEKAIKLLNNKPINIKEEIKMISRSLSKVID
ncbi:MAG: dTDP-4-dehydrorhamnose reductase, partial [Candidatus Aenigmatarchaeota archaeon]